MNARLTTSWMVAVPATLLLITGCATSQKLAAEPAAVPELAQLEAGVAAGAEAGLPLLSPGNFAAASESLQAGEKLAVKNRPQLATSSANEGLAHLTDARATAQTTRDLMADVITLRERAERAGATRLYRDDVDRVDGLFADAARLIEAGRAEDAKKRRPRLLAGYADLEVRALKEDIGRPAFKAIADAERVGAHKDAPRTLQTAREELKLALAVLDTNRSDVDQAARRAQRSVWLAHRSRHLADLVADFKRRGFTLEDVVLWHQEQLDALHAPVGGTLPFNRPNREVVATFRTDVEDLKTGQARAMESVDLSKRELLAMLAERDAQIADLRASYEAELSAQSGEMARMATQERETRARFDKVQALFTNDEANVFRQRQNVLISAHGFSFPSGKSEIDAVNFALANKIVTAIRTFPDAQVLVTGHTDATGDAELNQRISGERADKLGRFLVEVGGVPADHVATQGLGEERPVASNGTPEGRAANRRVEVLIFNK